ncbi:glycosyltransferase family 4 protein [Pseudidiomarina marina]|uniref:glycosyltransferase family 4 protein n=1 Tax=Pseudidiomarina marina TaxID=502366 RepID=UPI00384B2356
MAKLLLLIDDYLPHSTRVAAKMFHELSLELVKLGNEVTVVTPNSVLESSFEEKFIDGIRVWYFQSGDVKTPSKIKRAITETLLSYRAWSNLKFKFKSERFDGIVYYSPSIFWGGLVKRLKRLYQVPAYLVLRDIFPQWTIDAGMIREGSVIHRYFKYFELLSYRQADMIGMMSEANINFFNQLHGNGFPLEVLRNWASLNEPTKPQSYLSQRERLGLQNKVIFFYGGNIGHAQDMANLMRLARALKDEPEAHFLFVGQGDEVELINQLAKEWQLDNVSYLPSIDQESFAALLDEVDIGLFSLSNKHSSHNFPGKLLGYMQHKLPILGSVNKGNDLISVVDANKAGYISINGNDEILYSNAITLLSSLDERTKLGENGYKLLTKEFSVEAAAQQILVKLLMPSDK